VTKVTRRIAGPALARTNEEGERWYLWDGERYPSVTTLIGEGWPKWLHQHYAKMTADLATMDLAAHGRRQARTMIREWARLGQEIVDAAQAEGRLQSLKPSDLTELALAQRYLKGAAPRHRDQRRDEGSDIHAEAEDLILASIGKLISDGVIENDRMYLPSTIIPEYPTEIESRMLSFTKAVNDFRPRILVTEASVFNLRHVFAGTLDTIWEIFVIPPGELAPRWVRVLIDFKSGGALYDEVALQESAYIRGDFIGLPDGSSIALPKCEFAAALHLTPKGYHLRWLDVSDEVFEIFLAVTTVAKSRLTSDGKPSMASTWIGADILPVEEAGMI
jgi:hypothetical protein